MENTISVSAEKVMAPISIQKVNPDLYFRYRSSVAHYFEEGMCHRENGKKKARKKQVLFRFKEDLKAVILDNYINVSLRTSFNLLKYIGKTAKK